MSRSAPRATLPIKSGCEQEPAARNGVPPDNRTQSVRATAGRGPRRFGCPVDRRDFGDENLRPAGAIVDSVASAAFVVPILVFTDLGYWTGPIFGGLSSGTISLVGFAWLTAMQGYLLATRGQTIGKWLMGTRIVRADNDEVPTLTRTLSLRYATLALGLPATLSPLVLVGAIPYPIIVFGLIDIALIFRRDRRCLHDLIAPKVVAVAR